MDNLKIIEEIRANLKIIRECTPNFARICPQAINELKRERFADEKILDELSGHLEDLRSASQNCVSLYAQINPQQQIPNEFSTLENTLRREEEKIKSKHSRSTAERFMHLRAKDEATRKILEKEQANLMSILSKTVATGKSEKEIARYSAFITAMNERDANKKIEHISTLHSAMLFDNSLIAAALLTGTLVFDDVFDAEPEEVEVPDDEPENATDETDDESPEVEILDAPGGDTHFAEVARSAGLLISSGDKEIKEIYDKFFVEKSKREEKEFSVKKFKEECRGSTGKEKFWILTTIFDFGCLSLDMIPPMKDSSPELFAQAAEFLYGRGYLRKYGFEGRGSFYGKSPNCLKIYASKEAAAFLELPADKSMINHWLDDKAFYALPRLVYTKLLSVVFKKMDMLLSVRRNLIHNKSFIIAKVLMNESFFVDIIGPYGRDILIGCFWVEGKECDRFFEKVRSYITRRPEKIFRVIFAGIQKTFSRKLFETFKNELKDDYPQNAKTYFYAADVDKFFYGVRPFHEAGIEKIWSEKAAADFWRGVFREEHDDDDDGDYPRKRAFPEKPTVEVLEETPEKKTVKLSTPLGNWTVKVTEVTEDKIPPIREDLALKITPAPSKAAPAQKVTPAPAPKAIPAPEKVSPPVQEKPATVETPYMKNLHDMLKDGKYYCATAYVRALTPKHPELNDLYRQIAAAVNDPQAGVRYESEKICELIASDENVLSEYLVVAATVRTFFYNNVAHDFAMHDLQTSVKSFSVVDKFPELDTLIFTLMNFKNTFQKGADFYADYRRKDKQKVEKELVQIQASAKDNYDSYFTTIKERNAQNLRYLETKKAIFGKGSDLNEYFKVVVDDNREYLPMIEDYLKKFLASPDADVDADNISDEKINVFIDDMWEEGGRRLDRAHKKKTSKLIGNYRNSTFNTLRKVFALMCDWVACARVLVDDAEDYGRKEYQKISKQIKTSAQKICVALSNAEGATDEESAGIRVLSDTLWEICYRIEGNYNAAHNRYFYIEFLLAPNIQVLLDENYFPDYSRNMFPTEKISSVADRILAHYSGTVVTPEEKLKNIFEDNGDDFGFAEMIDGYLEKIDGRSVMKTAGYDVDYNESINYAKKDAAKKKRDFEENLEFAQSAGRIINDGAEDKKEKILRIVTEWYDYAEITNNYGVFRRIKEYWENRIMEDARKREGALRREFEEFKNNLNLDLDEEEIKKRVDKIEQTIARQNYTVAEELITRFNKNDIDGDFQFFDEDRFDSFMQNYNYYYGKTGSASKSLASIVGKNSGRNKDARGGARLAENWMVNGNAIGINELKNLLELLGFNVEDVKRIETAKKPSYLVALKKPSNGRKSNYKHPMAVFGSGAENDGFRVTCLFGKYDADSLIGSFKDLGSAKNTLVLLDYALNEPQRRRLARKLKEEMLGKVFAVIDRVMMMYLIENYNDQKISSMLMSLMMPFTYYQPYIWDAGIVMPPEMFIGRKEEIEKIESPAGVNIVYGGRQLGKSALLKMARKDIDRNENNDRAILVDIKGKNYREAAKKVCQTLIDEEFFSEKLPVEIDDWSTLARAIKNRLNERENHIPYFLLLLDEADDFIESCKEVEFRPIEELKDIQSIGENRFKFVIAGLRNLIRFDRELLGQNYVLPKLGSMTVKPFSFAEARELLEVPLYYLGLRFPSEKDSLISLILANTNYFPGLIQLYCAKLLEAMTKQDYASYDEQDSPPYVVHEQHIKKVIADKEFRVQIREKFEITLRLGNDNYYYVIALALALLYHRDASESYSPPDVLEVLEEFDLSKILGAAEDPSGAIKRLEALMEELCDLNVLRKSADEKYLFARYTFLQMMGNAEEVELKLIEESDK